MRFMIEYFDDTEEIYSVPVPPETPPMKLLIVAWPLIVSKLTYGLDKRHSIENVQSITILL